MEFMNNTTEMSQPFQCLGVQTWLDENDRFMMSINKPSNKVDKFTVAIKNKNGDLVGHLLFKKQLRVKGQTLFSVEELILGDSQTQYLPNWLQLVLGQCSQDS